jgi:hypothetical protein
MRPALTLAALLGLSWSAVQAQETLDLTVNPDDVTSGRRPGVVDGPSMIPERTPGVPHPQHGWSLRPEAELDLRTAEGDGAAGGGTLKGLELDLESMGMRLQRTW